jgi:hypothetical protein
VRRGGSGTGRCPACLRGVPIRRRVAAAQMGRVRTHARGSRRRHVPPRTHRPLRAPGRRPAARCSGAPESVGACKRHKSQKPGMARAVMALARRGRSRSGPRVQQSRARQWMAGGSTAGCRGARNLISETNNAAHARALQ